MTTSLLLVRWFRLVPGEFHSVAKSSPLFRPLEELIGSWAYIPVTRQFTKCWGRAVNLGENQDHRFFHSSTFTLFYSPGKEKRARSTLFQGHRVKFFSGKLDKNTGSLYFSYSKLDYNTGKNVILKISFDTICSH